MTELATLLTVQELDNTAGALRHRLANLAERRALDEAQALVTTLEVELAERSAPRRELESRQRRLEDEAATLRVKVTARTSVCTAERSRGYAICRSSRRRSPSCGAGPANSTSRPSSS